MPAPSVAGIFSGAYSMAPSFERREATDLLLILEFDQPSQLGVFYDIYGPSND